MNAFFYPLGIASAGNLIVATAIFLILPGPGTFCILTSASRHGLRGGLSSVIGVMMGDAVLMFLAAIGVAALLHANLVLFKGLQYIGAVYLAWLGYKLFRAKGKGEGASASINVNNSGGVRAVSSTLVDWRRGFFVTLINPKAIIFYMAFFPLFIDPVTQRGSITFLTMGVIISSCTLIYGSLLVLAGNAVAKHMARHRLLAQLASKAAGIFLIGFGIKLTTS
ncbi:leucine efflux protein LeuE [Glaciimonas immobilis]|uniref:Threonine/homoserine/homoserine lactone efflux protein n=1 Tax=Glaciimonas immobilis TaxID=728004 RepID=A0A840RS11_9BURK|nr:leucine efflux protein LeuE [Glaciimonas immobilis]KAF3996959.1 leucine efflux protein LeuE [Glaciimonas immobilis]MBB5199788.1 threonine/homoserine/homoserine lactone efflux protein [Glaciimonas immobilis]